MLLSIIIPRYKESEKDIFPLLSSIAFQLEIKQSDIEVIIANDNPSQELDLDCFEILGLNLSQITLEKNSGAGIARQVGLDNATGKYVMFCDADDTLNSVGVLSAFFKELNKFPETDYFSSVWLEEVKNSNTGEMIYITHELENTWLHGKMIRRSLITDNNIKFHEKLRVHEDSYFLSLLADVAQSRRQLNIPSYVWKWHGESITRRNEGLYLYEDFPVFIHSICLANAELIKRKSKMIEYHVAQFLIYCFFTFSKKNWLESKVKAYRDAAIQTLKEHMLPFWQIWDNTDKDYITKIYNEERNKNFSDEIEITTLNDFIGFLRG